MNKKEIQKEYATFLKTHNLKPEDFVLGAGGACLMYGLRDQTDDMDMDLPSALFDVFLKSGKHPLCHFGKVEVLSYNEAIDLHRRVQGTTSRLVEGVQCYTPETLLAQKLQLNRPKDQKDIKALRDLIAKEAEEKVKPLYQDW